MRYDPDDGGAGGHAVDAPQGLCAAGGHPRSNRLERGGLQPTCHHGTAWGGAEANASVHGIPLVEARQLELPAGCHRQVGMGRWRGPLTRTSLQ